MSLTRCVSSSWVTDCESGEYDTDHHVYGRQPDRDEQVTLQAFLMFHAARVLNSFELQPLDRRQGGPYAAAPGA